MRSKTQRWQGAADPPIVCNTPVDPTVTPNPEVIFVLDGVAPSIINPGEWTVSGTLTIAIRSKGPGVQVIITMEPPETPGVLFMPNKTSIAFTYDTPTLGSWVMLTGTALGHVQTTGYWESPVDDNI